MAFTFKFIPLFSGMLASFAVAVSPVAQLPTDVYAATSCKTGFKTGKTPVSLVVGNKPGCYNVNQAALGKKLLTGTNNTCFACHTLGGSQPYNQMNSNMRAQGYTLQPAQVLAAFNAHQGEMLGATLTSKDAKAISNFLQSIR